MSNHLSSEEAVEELAKVLHITMNRFDPPENAETWDGLDEDDRHFYRMCVRALIRERVLIQASFET